MSLMRTHPVSGISPYHLFHPHPHPHPRTQGQGQGQGKDRQNRPEHEARGTGG